MTHLPVIPIDALDLRYAPRPWAFAEARRAEIDAHFALLARHNGSLFNGRVLVMHTHAISGRTLSGAYLETGFASFIAWRDWGFPDPTMRNCFALGALRGSDGAYVLGVMGSHTANAGRIYFPGGTPDPSDIVEGRVDLDGSVRREVMEETGLNADEFEIGPAWHAVLAGPRLALIKIMQAEVPAERLRERIAAQLARQSDPELAGLHLVRGALDLDDRMPPFVHAFFREAWRDREAARNVTELEQRK